MNVPAVRQPGRGGLVILAVLVAAAAAALISLGTWQVERKAWKDDLIATLEHRLAERPGALPASERWGSLKAADDEFRQVAFPAEFVPGQEALVYSSGSSLRPDATGPGYWVFSPARLPGGGIVVVNRGFVPEGRQDPKSRSQGNRSGVFDLAGVLRWPETPGLFTPKDEPAKNLWFTRDPAAMAAAKGWGPVAPFYVDQEAPPAPGGFPKVGPLKISLPNNHLQYAITWYGLTIALLVVSALFFRSRLRERRAEAVGRP